MRKRSGEGHAKNPYKASLGIKWGRKAELLGKQTNKPQITITSYFSQSFKVFVLSNLWHFKFSHNSHQSPLLCPEPLSGQSTPIQRRQWVCPPSKLQIATGRAASQEQNPVMQLSFSNEARQGGSCKSGGSSPPRFQKYFPLDLGMQASALVLPSGYLRSRQVTSWLICGNSS